jgi:hypothetical protein
MMVLEEKLFKSAAFDRSFEEANKAFDQSEATKALRNLFRTGDQTTLLGKPNKK